MQVELPIGSIVKIGGFPFEIVGFSSGPARFGKISEVTTVIIEGNNNVLSKEEIQELTKPKFYLE